MDTKQNGKHVYDIKFEVVLKEASETVPGKASLIKAMSTLKNVKRKKEKIDFFDTNGMQISPDLRGIEDDEIEGRFCMEIGGLGKSILFFACTVQSLIVYHHLKSRTLNKLKKHNIFMKIHRGGYKYGVNWSPIGFFLKHHPSFVDNGQLRETLMKKITKSWNNDKEFFDEDQKDKIRKIIDNDPTNESFDPANIPFEIIQSSVFAQNAEKEKV